jgi:hypothetical protein
MRWLLLAVLTRHSLLIVATKCFPCEGLCGTASVCNGHTGLCHGEYCYSERTPADAPFAYRISKGCMKRPSRTKTGCDYDQMEDNVLCVCKGETIATIPCLGLGLGLGLEVGTWGYTEGTECT